MKLTTILALILISPIIFSLFFLACRVIACYLFPAKTNQTKENTDTMKNKEIIALIESAKGKFFSLTFEKKDGTRRTINSKDKYFRLLKGGKNNVAGAGYVSLINRNKENWFCFQPERVIAFKCGAVEKTF